jgi:transcriptional regulator of aromatic amino acid metabolism
MEELPTWAAINSLDPQDRTFAKLNCAAISTGLLESELFGLEKGAFKEDIPQLVILCRSLPSKCRRRLNLFLRPS